MMCLSKIPRFIADLGRLSWLTVSTPNHEHFTSYNDNKASPILYSLILVLWQVRRMTVHFS